MAALALLTTACDGASKTRQDSTTPAQAPGTPAGADPAASGSSEAAPDAPAQPATPRIEPEVAIAGPPGPLELPIQGAAVAAQLGGVTATETLVALAYRVEAPGEQCIDSQLERCHRWYVVLAARDGSAQPTQVLVAESDTPSGIELEALLPLGTQSLITLAREGRYTGDSPRLVASFIGPDATVVAQHDLLPGAGQEVRDATAAALDDRHAVVCWSGDDARRQDSLERFREQRIWCRRVGLEGADTDAALLGAPSGQHRAPALAFRNGHGMLAWVRRETLEVVTLDEQLRPTSDVIALGPANPRQPAVLPGHGGFLVVWQDPRGGTRAQRLETDGARFAPPIDLGGHGIRFVPNGGAVAVPQGFLVAATPDDWTRLVLIDPPGESARLLNSKDNTPGRLVLGSNSLLELSRKRNGQVIWREAISLLQDEAPQEPPP